MTASKYWEKDLAMRRIARKVRKQCELYAERYPDGMKADLSGMCGLASYSLRKELYRNGLRTKIVQGIFFEDHYLGLICRGCHCWLEWRDKIVDITATQFGVKRKVLIADIGDKRYSSGRAIPYSHKWGDWYVLQRPTKKRATLLLTSN